MIKSVVVFFLGCLVLASSCQRPEKKENVARINIVSDPSTLDPRKTRSLNERIIALMLFEGLTRRTQQGNIENALAEEILMNEEGTCYTVHLKKAYWSNGDLIQASDFVRTWQQSLDPAFPSPNAYQLFCLQNAKEIKQGKKALEELGVYAKDEKTLTIHLESPLPYFLELLSFPIFFPVHATIQDKGLGIYSGPFVLQTWKENDILEVVKNAMYWDADTVQLPGVSMIMVSEDTELRMFQQGELDWAGSPVSALSLSLVGQLNKEGKLGSSPMLGTVFYRINVDSSPCNHLAIRKALALAMDRRAIVDHVTQGGQKVALRLVPNSDQDFFQDADIEQAKHFFEQGLEELQCPLEEFPELTILYILDEKNHLIAQTVQQNWETVLGIRVKLEACEPKVYFQRLAKQDYQIAAGSWIGDYNDPETFLEVFKYKEASTNNTKWENPTYTKLLSLSRTLQGSARQEVLGQCEALLMQEMPIIPIYHTKSLYLQSPKLQGVYLSPLGNLDFKWAHVENPEEKE